MHQHWGSCRRGLHVHRHWGACPWGVRVHRRTHGGGLCSRSAPPGADAAPCPCPQCQIIYPRQQLLTLRELEMIGFIENNVSKLSLLLSEISRCGDLALVPGADPSLWGWGCSGLHPSGVGVGGQSQVITHRLGSPLTPGARGRRSAALPEMPSGNGRKCYSHI